MVVPVLISFLVSCLFSFCVSCAPELPSLASYLRESLVSPLVLSLRYPFHRCRAYGDGAPLHRSASSASASSVHVCARLCASPLPSVDLIILAVVCLAFRPSTVTCRYVARRHFPVCAVGSLLRCCCCCVVVYLRMPAPASFARSSMWLALVPAAPAYARDVPSLLSKCF